MNNSSSDAFVDLPTCSRIVSTMLTAAISFVSMAAFVGNCLVTVTFLINTTLRTSTNYFIVNMAVSDLLSSSTNWPLSATEGLLSSRHVIEGSMAAFVCKLGMYFRVVSQAVSVQSLLLIVVDRYIAIVLPFKAIHVSRRLRAVLLLFTWIFPLLFGIPYIGSSKIVQKGHQAMCSFSLNTMEKSIYYSAGFLTFYCVPLISIIILYSRIMKNLRQTSRGGKEQEYVRIRNLYQNKIIMKDFLWIVSAFFICWTPLCVYLVLKIVFPSFDAKDSCKLASTSFFYIFPPLNTVINPVILFVSSSRFSKALKDMFSRCTCKSFRLCKSPRVSPQQDVLEMQIVYS